VPGSTAWNGMTSNEPKEHLTGKLYDSTTGLYYSHARWYDPQTGRFVGKDPILTEQKYVFVANIPTGLIDSTGLSDEAPANKYEPSCTSQAAHAERSYLVAQAQYIVTKDNESRKIYWFDYLIEQNVWTGLYRHRKCDEIAEILLAGLGYNWCCWNLVQGGGMAKNKDPRFRHSWVYVYQKPKGYDGVEHGPRLEHQSSLTPEIWDAWGGIEAAGVLKITPYPWQWYKDNWYDADPDAPQTGIH